MTEKIIALRPHHLDRLVSYYSDRDLFDKPNVINNQTPREIYGKKYTQKVQDLFDFIVSGGTGQEYILIINGLDALCHMHCPRKKEHCSEPDSLSLWYGSGYALYELDLREGFLYPIKEFLEKIKLSY